LADRSKKISDIPGQFQCYFVLNSYNTAFVDDITRTLSIQKPPNENLNSPVNW